ncbi:GGDEF domain-containing protein [Escherichia coli]|nr:GGDEF domain-containing protein [Escherichia coli]EJS1758738.1 GGDEF domain-containing protein [Escherichia coli]EKD3380308.1 GGDEF domain-containing protein [Escherichia coli]
MKLHHRMLRHFIAASVIVLTSSFLIFELVASDRAMSAYLRYIVQKADSSFLYDKYQNQSIAAHVMRALAAEQSEVSPEQRRAICEAFESANNTHGLNLTAHKYPGLRGTLQTASTDCDTIVEAAALLPAFDQAVEGNRHQDDYGSGLGMAEEKFHYYLDLNDRYVYFYEPVNVEYFAMNNWSFLQSGSIGIDRKDIEKVFTGRTVLSSIYQDQRTKQNVMSLLTPVYVAGQLKGIVLLDINKNNLRNIFYTHDRPLLWRFLNVTLTDTDSGRDIIINQSEDNLFQYVSYVHGLPGGIRVSLSIDILYFITSSWKSVLFWILTALILLNMVRMHFRLYQNVSRENISDAMTGLYNRKILTPELEQRLQKLVQAGSSVMFIAIDMDKLKQINDTLGHQEGDLAITLLAQAIKQSIRKSDYAIRLGGDEFCIILVDSTPQIAAQLPERIEKRLQHIAPQKEIGFSSGIYAMKENDTLHDAYKASDERLYVNKQNKNSRS